MLQEQIDVLIQKEKEITDFVYYHENEAKKAKADLIAIKKAKQSLEKLEEQLNGQVNISE